MRVCIYILFESFRVERGQRRQQQLTTYLCVKAHGAFEVSAGRPEVETPILVFFLWILSVEGTML